MVVIVALGNLGVSADDSVLEREPWYALLGVVLALGVMSLVFGWQPELPRG